MITVLQLDTDFPRVPGDVGCAETYHCDVEIIRVSGASVSSIVTSKPQEIDIAPFEQAVAAAKGDVIVTSCGFLSYWQDHLARLTERPFISSALVALDHLHTQYEPGEVLVLTFDEASLTTPHLGKHAAYACGIVGLPDDMHLREVISQNRRDLDVALAAQEIAALAASSVTKRHRCTLLECTNLPPYKAEIARATGLPVFDILTQIEHAAAGSIMPAFVATGGNIR